MPTENLTTIATELKNKFSLNWLWTKVGQRKVNLRKLIYLEDSSEYDEKQTLTTNLNAENSNHLHYK